MLSLSSSRTLRALLSCALVAFAVPALAQQVLRVTTIPEEAATEQTRKFGPIVKYLENKLGQKVEFIPVSDYPAAVEALVNKQVDMVWFGGFTFVQASVRGWDHYMRSPEAANAAITKSNPEMGPDILKFGVETMQTMVYTKDTKKLGTGAMTVARWKELIETMTKLELTKPGQVHPEDCFTTEFLPVQAAKPNETTPAK